MRRIAIGLGTILVLLITLATTILAFRFRITAAALRYALSQAGFADARFDFERFDWSGLAVARLESGAALRIERCEVDFDWRRLPRLPVDRVRLVDLRLDATKRSAAAETGSAAPVPLALVPALELEDAVVTVASPIGPVTVHLDSQVAPASGALRVHLEGRAEGEAASAAFSGDARLVQGGPLSMTVNLSAIDVRDRRARITGGTIEAGAHLYWRSGAGVSGDARLLFEDVSLGLPRVRIEGLDGEVKLREISPPATMGLQTLRAREIHPGVLFSDATLRWALEPVNVARGSRLRIEGFQAGFADGKVTVDDAVLDPLATTNTIVFHVEALDLAKLFAMANLEGVGGSGRFSGAIPVAVRSGAVAIPRGELTAKGGVLQVRSQEVASLLSGGGQSVELLLDVLRDFHYEELIVTVEKAFEGEAAVRLQLAGENPAVMNGHPFRINLNLTGNLDRLVDSLLEIARLSDQTARATVRAFQRESPR